MSETLLWVVGGGGLLGSHLRRALSQHVARARLWEAAPPHFSWTDPGRLAEELSHAVATFAGAVRAHGHAWGLLWCAGIGVMSSSPVALEPEWSAWTQMLDLLGRHLAGPVGDAPGAIFLASSAGGVYGGSLDELLTENTPPQPVSAYGAHKLRMEEALRNWAGAYPKLSFLIGRISSLYGPGQDLHKAQGIISHLSRCLIYHRPANIYVTLDTRRDYLFADDCAYQIAVSLSRLMTERPSAILKIFASEELICLGRILGIFIRMAKQRPLIVSSQQPRGGTQPTSLKLRSGVWRDLQGLRKTDLATGIHLMHEHQLALFRQGRLPPPS
jgi:UDP-glucose 4-epimerase